MLPFSKKEGRRVRTINPMAGVEPFIMVERNTATNQFRDSIDMDLIEPYIRQKKAEGLTHFNLMHVLVAAYIRTVSQRPAINRFIRGQRIHARNGIEVVICIKKDMKLDSPDTCVKIPFTPDCTAEDVYNGFEEAINSYRDEPGGDFDAFAGILNYLPGVLMKFAIWLIKLLDYFGLLPRRLTKLSPFHGSLFITSIGSLGLPTIYHHLYDLGNLPVFLAFGAKYKRNEIDDDGNVLHKSYVDYTVTMDERICDGFYYANALKLFRRIIRHPEKLDQKPESVIPDIK